MLNTENNTNQKYKTKYKMEAVLQEAIKIVKSEEFNTEVQKKKIEFDNIDQDCFKLKSIERRFKLGFNHYDEFDEEKNQTIIVNELIFNCDVGGIIYRTFSENNVYFFIRFVSFYTDENISVGKVKRRDCLEFGTKRIIKKQIQSDISKDEVDIKEEFIISSENMIKRVFIFLADYYKRIISDVLNQLSKLVHNQEEFTNINTNILPSYMKHYTKRGIYHRNYENELTQCLMLTTVSYIIPNENFSKQKKEIVIDYYSNYLLSLTQASRYFIGNDKATSINLFLPNARTELRFFFTKSDNFEIILESDSVEEKHRKQELNKNNLRMSIALDDDLFSEERTYSGISFDDIYCFLVESEIEFSF